MNRPFYHVATMSRVFLVFAIALGAGYFMAGCDAFSTDPATISGQVVDDDTGVPIAGAQVNISPLDISLTTDANGLYTVEIELDDVSELEIIASKEGYRPDSVSVDAEPEQVNEIEDLRLELLPSTVTIRGLVLRGVTTDPVEGARVLIEPVNVLEQTDAQGQFVAEFDVAENTSLTLTVSKDDFVTQEVLIEVEPGETVNPLVRLEPVDLGGTVTIRGFVLDGETNDPIEGATVIVAPSNVIVQTDPQGQFIAEIQIDDRTTVTISARKEGFSTEELQIEVVGGQSVITPDLKLEKIDSGGPESGKASNILLFSQSEESIGVKESGSVEVAEIVFQAADSLGRPINTANAVDMEFSFGERPGGEEFLFPTVVRTDGNGQAKVNLSSGTRAGVVQIIARAVVDGVQIRSLPVAITIHGGLPDQPHFTIGPERFNFPGLRFFNLTDPITVLVGDKYSNPVRPGTAVYFETSHGVIEGSVLTNDQGSGSVNLISGNPLPPDGIAVITGSTADENQQEVSGQTAVVFSGVPVISVTPAVAILDQVYSLRVSDQNLNPLVEGTSIGVRVEGTNVKAVGNTSVILDDTAFLGGLAYENVYRGPGATEFTFAAVSDVPEDSGEGGAQREPEIEAITITVIGENGDLEVVLTPTGEPFSPTEKVVGEVDASGTAIFRLSE